MQTYNLFKINIIATHFFHYQFHIIKNISIHKKM